MTRSDMAADRPRAELFSFGEFKLHAARRTLERAGRPIRIGARAFDILHALVDCAPAIVDRATLVGKVWGGAAVGETSLRHHVAALRKVLGDEAHGADGMIVTAPGRGYGFGWPVAKLPDDRSAVIGASTEAPFATLPRAPRSVIGRGRESETLTTLLHEDRFVSVVGPGGIGKTTLATVVAHAARDRFGEAVVFVDLSAASTPAQVLQAVLTALGLPVGSPEPRKAIVAALARRPSLVILDSCEHVIGPAAELADFLFKEIEHLSLLTTSREPLRVEGERVYRLSALPTPLEGAPLDRAHLLTYASVELFLDRLAAGGNDIEASEEVLDVVARICRKLDGIALALELAASRVGLYGLEETEALLERQFHLMWRHRRTAPARQQTLEATLRWSYDLLAEPERRALRRLAVYAGDFSLEDAQAVAKSDGLASSDVPEIVAGLVARSLLQAKTIRGAIRYQLLDTTRAFARARLREAGEYEGASASHARHICAVLNAASPGRQDPAGGAGEAGSLLIDVRAALAWSFADRAKLELSVPLAAAASRLFVKLALVNEAYDWARQGLGVFDPAIHPPTLELELLAAYGFASTRAGDGAEARLAFERGLALAEQVGDTTRRLHFLSHLVALVFRMGRLSEAIHFGERYYQAAEQLGAPAALMDAHGLLGVGLHLAGRHKEARTHIEASLAAAKPHRLGAHTAGSDVRTRTLAAKARDLWTAGAPQRAVALAHEVVADAENLGHPVSLCAGLFWAMPVFLWSGELDAATGCNDRLAYEANRLDLGYYRHVSLAIRGAIATRASRPEEGVDILSDVLPILEANIYKAGMSWFLASLAQGQLRVGRPGVALATGESALAHVNASGELFFLPELLRLKGEALAADDKPDLGRAERVLRKAMQVAQEQTATAWRLRSATTLATVLLRQSDRPVDVCGLIEPICRLYEPGSRSPDLTAARSLIDSQSALGPPMQA